LLNFEITVKNIEDESFAKQIAKRFGHCPFVYVSFFLEPSNDGKLRKLTSKSPIKRWFFSIVILGEGGFEQ